MKQFLALLLLTLTIASCSNSGSSFKRSKNDTVKTLAIYKTPAGYRYTDVYKVSMDSFMFFDQDSATKVKKWDRFQQYFVPRVDTLIGADSLGKPKLQTNYYPVPSSIIIKDMNINIDSLLKANPVK